MERLHLRKKYCNTRLQTNFKFEAKLLEYSTDRTYVCIICVYEYIMNVVIIS